MIKFNQLVCPSEEQWYLVIRGMRNSWESWEKSDSEFDTGIFTFGIKDVELACRLIKAGDSHGKFLRQLPVHFEITAPSYFWREFDTYHIGVVSNSTSQMHVLGKEPFTLAMFGMEDIPKEDQLELIAYLNKLRTRWITSGKRKGPKAKEWRALVQAIPDSWLYNRTVSTNYQTILTMIRQRKDHRLSEWRDFCTYMVENLDFADYLFAGEYK